MAPVPGRRSPTSLFVVGLLVLGATLPTGGATAVPPVDGPAALGDAQGQSTTDTGTVTTPDADAGENGDAGVLGLVTGVLAAIGGFLYGNPIGHALIGLPLGLYLGLKLIALYLEYYE